MNANEAFRTYLRSLSVPERNDFTANVASALEVSFGTINNWQYSKTRIKPIYRREISRIIGVDIFDNVTD